MPLVVGSRVDSYEIVTLLGAGGMGEVYRARDTSLKREVAIKVLPEFCSRDPDRLRRFELEAQAAAALNHPNIVSIFHVGRHNGAPYIVTELLHGESLRDRLRHGPMRLGEVLDLGIEIARGLAAAHDVGIVHRDLKPENLFLTRDGRLKILDFGLAKLAPGDADGPTVTQLKGTAPGQVMGTVGYMAPEQVRGLAADARTDIFALGVILYEMLTGHRAFSKPTSAETMSAILNEDPPPISQFAASTPQALQRVSHRCLAKNPEQRFQHAADLAFALEALSDSSSVSLAAEAHAPFSVKHWLWIAAPALLLMIAAVMGLYLWTRSPAVPVVEAVTQLSDDGVAKWIYTGLQTDGSRIYFNEGTVGSLNVAQVSVTGGATSIIATKLPNAQVVGLAPEGSPLLALHGPFTYAPKAVWLIPLPTGEPRRLGIEANWAVFASDGRILFSNPGVLYVAEKDGSSPRKLLDIGNGFVGEPSMSPDGKRMVFTRYSAYLGSPELVEIDSDGTGLHSVIKDVSLGWVCCARWTPDGRYIVFQRRGRGGQEIWAMPMKTGILPTARRPVKLTNGPLSYMGPAPSRDGNQVFAFGIKKRGEVVRYDSAAKQFVPFLSGISAFDPTFSSDGKWVAYTAYPDNMLWRSRSDGSERLQLTYAPSDVVYPFISPDGKHVAFGQAGGDVYVIGMDGGEPQRIATGNAFAPSWSPDSNSLVFSDYSSNHPVAHLLDLRTGKNSIIPGSQNLTGVQWITENILVAADAGLTGLKFFDFKTQQWSTLVEGGKLGSVINWAHSPDYHYLYYTTGSDDPKVIRVHFPDRKFETLASLKELRLAPGPDENTQISVAPDGSPVFTRDVGTQEIYAFTLKWP